ncbi:hypothetical protein GCK72_012914 [Caenorhabditis remanei]|uniref:CUT domain-containing protein n=1 Tax=Caenorhabditis remanei TaxID=31234 RepID=A0A6A5GP17_CAERE|nr:hypothetical protein GCK72_012914 [Caenorhabditis remanei]KAF1756461.1 hypothetical protein GCK72_012914 [Caenorhabditis remanei]
MIPTRALCFQQIIDESNYILTELTNVRHPGNTDCYGILKRKEVPISCFELDTVQIENRCETGYESRDYPISFGITDENQNPHEFEPATKRMKLEDSSVDQETPVGSYSLPKRGVTGELNNAIFNFNRPMPSSSPEISFSSVSSSLSLPTSTHSHSMSIEQALDLLSTPISYKINLNTKEIARQMREWFTLAICSQAFFAAHVLGVARNRFHRVLTVPPPFDSLKSGKELYIKMYNWLKLTEDVKKEILSVFGNNDQKSKKIAQEPEGEEEEYDCPKEISRKRQASLHSDTSSYSSLSPDSFLDTSITDETFNAIINKQINYVNTKNISILMKNWLQRTQATQRWFAKKILGRSRKTLGQCLNKPKDWKDLSQKRKFYVKMHNWMCLTEEQRHEMMKVYKAPNME